ncbi:nucleoside-diphosphate-sugar epimerase [Kutzneria viridogrisea]|uniref:Nucleoside-diphosphate-sugar epimerase n=1 Tax=Kutzneria viridogrisea TaxID=47990 RepID=A0ABR6BPX9_9PSEU|nr:nucleoside-diphosphate-sugar epimerase [Kutzneria viridogrisea]
MDHSIVLVTGSSGLVGSAVAGALRAGGWLVRGLDVRPGPETTHLADLDEPGEALDGVGAVVHAAALHAPHVGVLPDAEFHRVNVHATTRLVRRAADRGVRRFVYTSSTSVYGHALVGTDAAVWVTEELAPRPRDVYDVTKLAAERVVRASGLPNVVLRIARCFPEPPEVTAVHRLHRGVDLADVVDAHLLALSTPGADGVYTIAGPTVFEPGDGVALWQDAPSVIDRRVPGARAAFAARGWRLPDRIDRVYDSSAAARDLGYRPSRGLSALLA